MNSVVDKDNDRTHEEFQDLLSAAAFGTLTEEEGILLREHLARCAECQRELNDFQFIAAALPLTLDELQPAPQLRNRILAIVQHEHRSSDPATSTSPPVTGSTPPAVPEPPDVESTPQPVQRPVSIRTPAPIRPGYLWATAALVLVSVLAGAAVGRFMFADEPDDEPQGEAIAMQFSTPIPNVRGELMYMPDQRLFMLSMENMPAAPADHVYQVWLIDESGPIPAGVMDNSDGEFAVAADRTQYQALAITVEPAPLGSAGPTTKPIMVAPLDEAGTSET